MPQKATTVEIEGKQVKLSNLDKVLYPEAGFTKAQVIDYFVRIAPALLPHLQNRPLTMKRYPEGVKGLFFYEKNCPSHRPEWVQTTPVWSDGNNRWQHYCVINDLASLVWAANLADLELHTSLSLGKDIETPTAIVFDLDPGAPAGMVECCHAGLRVRELFEQLGLQSFAKTSGSKGLQIYVPLNSAVGYEETKEFAHEVARLLERQTPDQIVSDMKKALRTGKVFVDWSQNDQHKTTVCVYSLRAKERPTVSTPVTWDEVAQCLEKKDPSKLVFEASQTLARVEKSGDLFEPVLTLKQKLPSKATLAGNLQPGAPPVSKRKPVKQSSAKPASAKTPSSVGRKAKALKRG